MTKEELVNQVIQLNKEGEKDKQKYQQVIELLSDEVLEKEKLDILHAEKSLAFYRLKKYQESKLEAERALYINAGNAKANHYLGIYFYYDQKDSKKAEEYYQKAIELDPDYAYPYYGLGIIYYDQKDYKKAEEYYQKAIEINPDYVYPYIGLGYTNLFQQEYKKAEEYYHKAIEKDPDSAYPYHGLGFFYIYQRDFSKAEEYFKKAIEIDSNYDTPYFNLGLLYYFDSNSSQLQQAKYNFEKSIALTLDNPNEYTERAKDFVKKIVDKLNSPELRNIIISKDEIKNILRFDDGEISHFTSLSTVKALVIDKSKFILSEATFLNDSSEGKTIFEYLEYDEEANAKGKHEYTFAKKPFIGSFVHATKHNDLALWRLYGKEGSEEGKGCSITIDSTQFLQLIKDHASEVTKQYFDREFQFYKVAYWDDEDGFLVDNKPNSNLKKAIMNLKENVNAFKVKVNKTSDEEINVQEALNEIAYLFKNIEYQYENEIRLVIKDTFGYKKILDFDKEKLLTKVYIELCPIQKCIASISIGPKTPNKDDWAAYFHYYFDQLPDTEKMGKVKIMVSTLPYK